MEEEITEIVKKHGWYAASIYDNQPPFLYSIGLMQTFNHPEFILFGLEPKYAHALISELVRDIRAGKSFTQPDKTAVSVDGNEHRIGMRPVHPTQHELHLGFAMGYCRYIGQTDELRAMQVFWPDRYGKFPFESGCNLDVYQLQPRLDINLTPTELRQWRRQWE